jgi:hypothetical protein
MQDKSLCHANHKEMPCLWKTNAKAKEINLKEAP